MEFWSAPKLWEGETVIIVATGHSVTQHDVDYCRGKARVLVINTAIQLAPWADACYFADQRWGDAHIDKLKAFGGLKVSIQNAAPILEKDPTIKIMRNNTDKPGLCMEPDGLNTGRNSGYQGINLAVHLGVKRIVLMGFDLNVRPDKRWFFGASYGWSNSGPQIYENSFLPRFLTLASPIADLGIEVINCSMGSSLDCWEKREIQDVFRTFASVGL